MIPMVRQTVKKTANLDLRCMLLQICHATWGCLKPQGVRENKNTTDLRRTSNERLNQSVVCNLAARLPSASTNVLKANMQFSLKMWNLPSPSPNNSHQNPQAPQSLQRLTRLSFSNPPRFLNQVQPSINRQPLQTWYVLFNFKQTVQPSLQMIERHLAFPMKYSFSLPFMTYTA